MTLDDPGTKDQTRRKYTTSTTFIKAMGGDGGDSRDESNDNQGKDSSPIDKAPVIPRDENGDGDGGNETTTGMGYY